jgi:hypothetical protein
MPRKVPLNRSNADRYGVVIPRFTRWLCEGHGATHKEIAKELGVTVARVGQIEASALRRLRRCLGLIELGVEMDDAIRYCRSTNGRAV